MVETVPDTRRRIWLLGVDALGVVHVEAEEIDQLAGAVNLGLVCGLALAQHGCRVQELPMGAGQHLSGPEEDGGAVFEPPVAPVLLGLYRGLDRALDGAPIGLMGLGQHPPVTMRRNHVMGVAGSNLSPVYYRRDIGLPGTYRSQRRLEGGTFGRVRGIVEHRFIAGVGNVRGTAHHCTRSQRSGEDNQKSPAGGFPGPARRGWSSRVNPFCLMMAFPSGESTKRTKASAARA